MSNEKTNSEKFPIVTICGSTRFKEEIQKTAANLTEQGYISTGTYNISTR